MYNGRNAAISVINSDKNVVNKNTASASIKNKSEFSIMSDLLIVLVMLSLAAIYYYGIRAALIIGISVVTCVITDRLCLIIRHKEYVFSDISALITGITIGLMMSAAIQYYIVISACIFAIVLGKHAFGGHGHEIFNSAAVGYLFVALCFPNNMLSYPKPFNYLPLTSTVNTDLMQSMTKSILTTNTPTASFLDIIIGKFCGPMGTGFIVIMVVAALFLILRRSVSAISFFTQLTVVFLFSYVYYSYNLENTLYVLSSGMLLFGIIFLSCDFRTIPKTKSSRLMYGIITGGLVILFQYYAKVENAIVYAVIIAAPFGIELDRRALSFAKMLADKKSILGVKRVTKNNNIDSVNETISLINDEDK